MNENKKNVNRNFPNFSKYKYTPTVIHNSGPGDNRKAERAVVARARKAPKIPKYLTPQAIARFEATKKRVQRKVLASQTRRINRERLKVQK